MKYNTSSYGKIAKIYDFLDSLNYGVSKPSKEYFLDRLPIRPKNPLIIGCGTGNFAEAYVRTLRPDIISLNDISSSMLTIAVKRVKAVSLNIEIKTRIENCS